MPINLHCEGGVRMAELSLSDFYPGRLEQHGREGMAEGVKPYTTTFAINPELIEDGVEDFLDHATPVEWASNRIRKKQLVSVSR
jgi:hypothetical protein